MRLGTRLALVQMILTIPLASSLAQSSDATATVSSAPAMAFRKGLEVSADGRSWGQTRTVALPSNRCEPATTSPCASGTPPLVVSIRFPSLPRTVDGAKVLSQLGESGAARARYFVRPVPANAASTVCGGGFSVSNPLATMRVAINLGNPGAPLPVTCRWTAVAGVPDAASPVGFYLVWSDTVAVRVVTK